MGRKVILVPGFMGCNLQYPTSNGRFKQVWWDPTYLTLNGPGALQLADDGFSPGPLAGGVALSPQKFLPGWGDWTTLAERLTTEGWDVDFFAYDWRMSVVDSAAELADYLLGQYQGVDFWILAHSMGGLVARLAYGTYLAGAVTTHWQRTLYVGTPQYGSYDACRYLAAPWQAYNLYGILTAALLGVAGPLLGRQINGWIQQRLESVVVTWPALYELLPSTQGRWAGIFPLDALMYNANSYNPPNSLVMQKWLDASKTTRTAIDATLSAPRPSEKSVLGINLDTAAHVQQSASFANDFTFAYDAGDGAVPETRGTLDGADNARLLEVGEHQHLLGDTRFLADVTHLLIDPTPVPTEEPPVKGLIVIPPPPAFPVVIPTTIPASVQRRGDP